MAYKIMIVDDERDIVLVIKMSLEKYGYQTCEAYDGIEALEKIKTEKPDLVLLDLMMPRLDGHSVNLRLKENPETAGIPVIVITGKGHLKELLEIREELSVAAYLEKPFKVTTLIEKVKEILK